MSDTWLNTMRAREKASYDFLMSRTGKFLGVPKPSGWGFAINVARLFGRKPAHPTKT